MIEQRACRQFTATPMIRAERRLRQLIERAIQKHHFRVHAMQHVQIVVVQIVADHHHAVAIAADQKAHRLDRLLTRRHFPTAGRHHHVTAHRAQFGVGLLEYRAVVGAEESRHKNADDAERLRRHGAADRRWPEIQCFDRGLYTGGRVG